MSNETILFIAILKELKLLTSKEAHSLYDELKYKNLSTSLDDSLKLVKELFKNAHIGEKAVTSELVVGGKTIRVSK